MAAKRLIILGSTGSIGTATLDLVAEFPEAFEVVGLAAGRGGDAFERQIRRFRPRVASVSTIEEADRLRAGLGDVGVEILGGPGAAAAVAAQTEGDLVVSAIVGAAGLVPTLAAIRAGKTIALANKEVLVMAGGIVMDAARRHGVAILPVDSEHNAIHQCLHGRDRAEIRRLILTASGGPFRGRSASELQGVTADEALCHPTWRMGRKITIDSATLMNKGLEVIEAHWLFGLPADRIDVVIHRQSVVHSLVEYCDGSMLAQMGIADMRGPISYALAHPARLPLRLPPLDLAARGTLTFEPPDPERFPCLGYGYAALKAGGTAPAVLNAVNEEAVAAFLDGRIGFTAIGETIERVMGQSSTRPARTLDDILLADGWARAEARRALGRGETGRGETRIRTGDEVSA